MIHKFVTVSRLDSLIIKMSPVLLLVGLVSLVAGLIYGLILSPDDYQQHDAVRIMYIHVPSAWMSLFIYGFMAVLSFGYLVWKNPLCYLLAKSAAPIGAFFTLLCLVTGSIWGYPMWGTWWVWDARLTSVLVMFFIYLGYIALGEAFNSQEREAKSASVLCMVGAINVPIIKFSVEWWNTLHQPASVFRINGPTIDSSMLIPLLLMAVAWTCIFFLVLFFRIKTAILLRKIDRLT